MRVTSQSLQKKMMVLVFLLSDECDDSDSTTINDVLQSNCSCSGELDVSSLIGCMDNAACNFNPNAQEDNGSCFYVGDPCDDGNSNTTDDTINEL